ncbi:MAG: glycosidase [Anaerolineae bacterium]|nr:glycosidase [Anaerolineae bacterium]
MKLQRCSINPILLPDPTSEWECYNVFNAGVLYDNGLFYMFYRAQGLDWVSRIGYAVSVDGIHWNRLRKPVLEPTEDGVDSRGLEDPRVVKIEDMYYMTYTAYGREFTGKGKPTHLGGGILPMIARSTNLITWEKLDPLVRGEDNKDHVLFPRKIKGRFAALHRRWPNVCLAYSHDLRTWNEMDMAPIFGPRPDNDWDCTSVGGNGVPIETEHGWLMFYHAYDAAHIYRQGVCLLDLEDPTKVLRRPKAAIFWPEELWELRGDVPNVVFSCANPVVDGTIYFFYGGADHVMGLATAPLEEAVNFVLNAP